MGAKQVPVSGKGGDSPDAKMAEQVGLSTLARASMVHLGDTVSVNQAGCMGARVGETGYGSSRLGRLDNVRMLCMLCMPWMHRQAFGE